MKPVEQLMSLDTEPESMIRIMTPDGENKVPFYVGIPISEIIKWHVARIAELEAERDDIARQLSDVKYRLDLLILEKITIASEREACAAMVDQAAIDEGEWAKKTNTMIIKTGEQVRLEELAAAIRKRGE